MNKVEGVDYSSQGIEDLRKDIIVIRDGALQQAAFHWAVALSHNLALLAYLKEMLERQADVIVGPHNLAVLDAMFVAYRSELNRRDDFTPDEKAKADSDATETVERFRVLAHAERI